MEIRNRFVHVIDENGIFHEPEPTRVVLDTINLRTHSLICVKASDDWDEPAIARIVTRMQAAEWVAREKERAKEAKKKKPQNVIKVLELNWAIDNNDLGHRIVKIREFLSKGNRVEIIISPKRRGRKVALKEREALVARLRELVEGEEGKKYGWSEWKEMDGEVDPKPPKEGDEPVIRHKVGVVSLHFQGTIGPEGVTRDRADDQDMEAQPEYEDDQAKEGEEELEGMEEEEDLGDEKQEKKERKKKAEKKKDKQLTFAQLNKRDKWKRQERGEVV